MDVFRYRAESGFDRAGNDFNSGRSIDPGDFAALCGYPDRSVRQGE